MNHPKDSTLWANPFHSCLSLTEAWAITSACSEIVDVLAILVEHAEGRRLGVVAFDVPEDVHLLKGLTRNGFPVCLSICNAGLSSAKGLTRYWPAGFGNPHPLAGADSVDSVARSDDRVPECC